MKWAKGRPWIDPERFYRARRGAHFTQVEAAQQLGVTSRTIKNWEAGRVAIPYAAFRLMRLLGGYKLPGEPWRGYTLRGDTLWTPEQKPLYAWEMRWLSLMFAMARHWLQEKGYPAYFPASNTRRKLEEVQGRARRRAAVKAVAPAEADRGLPGPSPAVEPSTGHAGESFSALAAKRQGRRRSRRIDLSKEHIRTRNGKARRVRDLRKGLDAGA